MRDTCKILMQNPRAAARSFAACATPMVRLDPGILTPDPSVSPLNRSRRRRT
jgi:hypothetical protein